MLPSASICTCTSCVLVLALEPPAALRVLAQPEASAATAARITRAEILGMRVLLVRDPRPKQFAGPKKDRWSRRRCGAPIGSALEELLYFVEPAFRARIVARAVLRADRFELTQELALPRGELHRRLDDDVAEEVARHMAPHALDAL